MGTGKIISLYNSQLLTSFNAMMDSVLFGLILHNKYGVPLRNKLEACFCSCVIKMCACLFGCLLCASEPCFPAGFIED